LVIFADFMSRKSKILYLVSSFLLTIVFINYFFFRNDDSKVPVVEQIILPDSKPFIYKNLDSLLIAKKAKDLDRIFKRLVRLTGFNGNVLYAEKGIIIFENSYGYRDINTRKDPIQLTDAFQLASVSKMFTAMAIMILHERGEVDYDRDVRDYLKGFPYPDVTVRLLMNHRAGMPNYMYAADDFWPNRKIPLDNYAMLQMLIQHKPNVVFSPNRGFSYNNTNYALLANIVEVISGQHFDEFVEENIFKPLHMDSSFVYNLRGDSVVPRYIDRGIPGYYHRGRRWREMPDDYLNGVMGDKNVYTTVEDLYKFDRGLDNFTLVTEESLKEAFSPGSPRYRSRKDNYGFGWRIKTSMDSTVFHFGWWKGFRTFYIRDMRHQKTLIVLTNKEKGLGSSHLWNIIQSDTLPLGFSTDYHFKE